MESTKLSPGAELAAKRRTETKTCPECGEVRTAVIRASDYCEKCQSKFRMRKRKIKLTSHLND
jgi:hypothetical protein